MRKLGVALVLAVAAAGLAACAPQPTAGIACAWAIKADKATFNVAYPDTAATYFGTKFNLVSGQKLIISGTYPYARYMSLHTYSGVGNDFDHIGDTKIVPDPGSDNPFTTDPASVDPANRRWTVTLSPDIAPNDGQNGDNLIAAPTNGSVFLRVYVPNDPLDQAGGVPLPSISVRNVDGTVTPVAPCPTQVPDGDLINLINLFGPATDVPPSNPPVFRRPATVANLYANRDAAYLASIAAYQPGNVIVVRGKAPTAPDTFAGESPATPSQVRYWSFCTNEYRKPYPVSSCVVDHEAPLDGSGYYTIVVSTAAERPANATVGNGVTWVDWGSTSFNLLMAMRHITPDPSFAETVRNVANGQLASEVMGAYTPVAVTCPAATFEAGGAAACGL